MRKTLLLLTFIVAAALGLSGVMENGAMYGLIHADAQGYYGYLVATFIERSFDWEQVIGAYADVYFQGSAADFTVQSEWGRVNKYYVGTAVLMLPFFALSCLAAWLLGFPVDGYSAPFHIGIMLGALTYVVIGLYYLSTYLQSRGISRSIALFVCVLLLFASGLLHYSISEPAMSHAYSFSLFCAFMYWVDRYIKTGTRGSFVLSAVVFGLIVLVRPANGLILLSVPFLAGGLQPLRARILSSGFIKVLAVGSVVVITILSLQIAMYLAQVGQPLIWSYKDEGFNFLSPEILNVLFSYRKGFYIYTPLACLASIGLLWMLVKRRVGAGWLVAFLAFTVYVISSWWNWYYGGSLGMRALLEYLPFFGIGLAFLLQYSVAWLRFGLVCLCLFFTGVNVVQSYQYQKFILHWDSMNKERFWTVFMKTNRQYEGLFYRTPLSQQLPSPSELKSTVVFENNFDDTTRWGNQGLTTAKAFSDSTSTRVSAENRYGSTLSVRVSEMGAAGDKKLFVTAMVWSSVAFPELSIAYSYRNDSADYGHDYLALGSLIPVAEQWVEVQFVAPLHQATDSTHHWVVYPFTSGNAPVYVDDIRYEVFTLNPALEQP